ncbi:hypothetical protein ACWD4B_07930 [Streptomyces sp. NPDC002536]
MRASRSVVPACGLSLALLLPGSAAAADDCGTQVWRMTITEVDIRNGGDSDGGDLYGNLAFDGQTLWSRSRSDAVFVYNGPLDIGADNQWKLWDEKLVPVTGTTRTVFTVDAGLWDADYFTGDDEVAVGTSTVDPLQVGEGPHQLDYCHGSGCSEGHTVIGYTLEKVGECTAEQCAAGRTAGRTR